jgi:hypothetical protein
VVSDLEAPGVWQIVERGSRTHVLVRTVGGEYLVVIDELYTDEARAERFADVERRGVAPARRCHRATRSHADTTCGPCSTTRDPRRVREPDRKAARGRRRARARFDVGHHAYCGGDAVAFFSRHFDRSRTCTSRASTSTCGARHELGLFATAVAEGVFVEPALGVVDLPLRDVIVEKGYTGYAIVEQDMYPADPDRPLPIARRTYDYLTELGFR